MVRPHSRRKIGHHLGATFFKPAGVPTKDLEVTVIGLDELEAMRLVDGTGMKQVDAASQMNISQSTIARILSSGRKKCANALTNGEALQLEAGEVPLHFNSKAGCGKRRRRCGHGNKREE